MMLRSPKLACVGALVMLLSSGGAVAEPSTGRFDSATAVADAPVVVQGACEPQWTADMFPAPPGPNGNIYAIVEFDDGGGPALYVSGDFTRVGNVDASGIAKWDGSQWSALAQGTGGGTYGMCVFNDGSGDALYVAASVNLGGGNIARGIAKWDGTQWSALGAGLDGPNGGALALTVFDDGLGGGPALYAGGGFFTAGGAPAICMAKWDGTTWSPLGSGMAGGAGGAFTQVQSLCVFDDGNGPALYAGGLFATAGGVPAQGFAKWNGVAWSAVGSGLSISGSYPNVNSMVVFDDGSGAGESLFLAGYFTTAGGVAVNHIARWNGVAWSRPGPASGLNAYATELLVFDDGKGQGPALYIGGGFTAAGGAPAARIAKWNGVSFSALTTGVNGLVQAMVPYTFNGSTQMFIGGSFTGSGIKAANRMARWDGDAWEGVDQGINNVVYALTTFDDGAGEALYAGGDFTTAGSTLAANVARWDGNTWTRMSLGLNGTVYALAPYDSGSGPRLYAAGAFRQDSGGPAWRVAWWSGVNWVAAGDGTNNTVYAMTVFNDVGLGQGPGLYIGGNFTFPANRVARWNGSAWTPISTGFTGGSVRALIPFTDGFQERLYAGGLFTMAGSVQVNRIARWTGFSWSQVGGGMDNSVRALAVHDDGAGGGPALYAGGSFQNAGGVSANRIAKWDNVSWSAVGGGVDGLVHALASFDDGAGGGPALYAAGDFQMAGGVNARGIARWNGIAWHPVGGSLNGSAYAIKGFDDGIGVGPTLYAAGDFTEAGGQVSGYVARWKGCVATPPACPGDANGDNAVDFEDINAAIVHWLSDYGFGTGPGDANGDGIVSFEDIQATLLFWGASCGAERPSTVISRR